MNKIIILITFLFSTSVLANEYSYPDIAKRFGNSALTEQQVMKLKMEGECLVGLKELNFKKQREFDPVAEWTNYRSISLLEQFSPCQVLVIMETAQKKLRASQQKQIDN